MARRVELASSPGVHCVVVAQAAMMRLGWSDRVAEVIPISVLLPQVGQGTIAVECRVDDFSTCELLDHLDDGDSRVALSAERAFLDAVAGSCSLPLAAFAVVGDGGEIHLRAMLASGDGRITVSVSGHGDDPLALGRQLADEAICSYGEGRDGGRTSGSSWLSP